MSEHGKHGKRGIELLEDPLQNKGTAFTEEERDALGLRGMIPPHVETLDEQLKRAKGVVEEVDQDIEKYLRLRGLQESNEVLFYRLVTENLEDMLPLIYTPTVGEGCIEFSRHWRHPRGLFLSYPDKDRIADILAPSRFDDVEVIVVSDGERILGLGDQGANGMGIPIGKLSLYVGCGGFDPARTLPILLDTGTNSDERRNDPRYIGWRHERMRGNEYDAFLDAFIDAVKERWPHVLLQFEDFEKNNAQHLLERYRDQLCTFNDDVQGTAAIAAGTLLAATKAAGQKLSDQTVVIFGAGSAGCGIGQMLIRLMGNEGVDEDDARKRFYAFNSKGLLMEDSSLEDFQKPFARSQSDIEDWDVQADKITLEDVVKNAGASVLIGTSGQSGVFNEDIVRIMAKNVEHPIILPLSNPTDKSEAKPQDVVDWTDGKALIGTGSPFPPVIFEGKEYPVDQTNNAYIFPGIGLGAVVAKASRVTDGMFDAAARKLAGIATPKTDGPGHLLSPQSELRQVAREIALAVASQAIDDDVAGIDSRGKDELVKLVDDHIWEPKYR